MNHAYIISCYKLPNQVIKLVKILNSKGNIFLIHIDKNSSSEYIESIKNELSGYKNVVFLPRHKCYWGDFGHVLATIKAINYLIENNIKFDYFSVLTGQDYPIKPNKYIEDFFSSKNKSYVEHFTLPSKMWANGGMDRINKLYIWMFGKRISIPKNITKIIHSRFLKLNLANKNDFTFYGGSSCFSLTKAHTIYIYNFLKKNEDYERFFKYTYISDEIFFQTILLNSKNKNEIINSNIRLIDWDGPVEYPKIFRLKDFSSIKASKALFARKFDTSIDDKIIKEIDQYILKKDIK